MKDKRSTGIVASAAAKLRSKIAGVCEVMRFLWHQFPRYKLDIQATKLITKLRHCQVLNREVIDLRLHSRKDSQDYERHGNDSQRKRNAR